MREWVKREKVCLCDTSQFYLIRSFAFIVHVSFTWLLASINTSRKAVKTFCGRAISLNDKDMFCLCLRRWSKWNHEPNASNSLDQKAFFLVPNIFLNLSLFFHHFVFASIVLGDLTNGQLPHKANGNTPYAPYQNGHANGDDEKCTDYTALNGDAHIPYTMPYDDSTEPPANLIDAKRTERNKFFGSLPNHLDTDETCDETCKCLFYSIWVFGKFGTPFAIIRRTHIDLDGHFLKTGFQTAQPAKLHSSQYLCCMLVSNTNSMELVACEQERVFGCVVNAEKFESRWQLIPLNRYFPLSRFVCLVCLICS